MAWVGFERYGRLEDAQRLAYRWLYMMTTAFVDFNGVVPEKVCSLTLASSAPVFINLRYACGQFDAVKLSHMVDAEYGNQGVDFKMIPREGFGWMNGAYFDMLSLVTCGTDSRARSPAAYQVGLTFITEAMRRALNSCVSPEKFFSKDRMRMMDATIQVPIGMPDEEEFDPIDLALEAIMGV
jgi:alpha,alpha-trehalase